MTALLFSLCALAVSLLLSFASGRYLSPLLRLPTVSVYLLCGVLCGRFGLALLDEPSLQLFSPLSQLALYYICFSAGAELSLGTLLPHLRRILLATGGAFAACFVGTGMLFSLVSEAGTGLLPAAIEQLSLPCRRTLGGLAASILVTFSPAVSLAVVRELHAKGPLTAVMLGVTMLGDVLALLAFAVVKSLAHAACDAAPAASEGLLHSLAAIAASTLAGAAVGFGVGAALRAPNHATVPVLLLLASAAAAISGAHLSSTLHAALQALEPMLLCLTAGCFAVNTAGGAATPQDAEAEPLEQGLSRALSTSAPLVFLYFFTLSGAQLDVATLGASAGLAVLFGAARAGCIAAGVWLSGWGGVLGVPAAEGREIATPLLTLSLITQAGLSVGLAGEVGRRFGGWGRALETCLGSVVLLNQFAGPFCATFALKRAGEARKEAAKEPMEGEALLAAA
jgi:hypothetical protein